MLTDYDDFKIEPVVKAGDKGLITTFLVKIGDRKFTGDTQDAVCKKIDAKRREELQALTDQLKAALPKVTFREAAALFRRHGVDGLPKLRAIKPAELAGDLVSFAKPLKARMGTAPTSSPAKVEKPDKAKKE